MRYNYLLALILIYKLDMSFESRLEKKILFSQTQTNSDRFNVKIRKYIGKFK